MRSSVFGNEFHNFPWSYLTSPVSSSCYSVSHTLVACPPYGLIFGGGAYAKQGTALPLAGPRRGRLLGRNGREEGMLRRWWEEKSRKQDALGERMEQSYSCWASLLGVFRKRLPRSPWDGSGSPQCENSWSQALNYIAGTLPFRPVSVQCQFHLPGSEFVWP